MKFTSITDALHINSDDMNMALRAAGAACKAVDIVMSNDNTNVFSCTHPPGNTTITTDYYNLLLIECYKVIMFLALAHQHHVLAQGLVY